MLQAHFIKLVTQLAELIDSQSHITMLLKEINKNHNIINELSLFVVDGPEYPHSHSSLINRHGKVNSMQRYCCKSCLKTFKATTGISLARLHYKE